MSMDMKHSISLLLATALYASSAYAAVSPEEAARLKTVLTPLGAERAGNKDGSIPEWTGALTEGAALDSSGHRGDPFAGEKPLYSIGAKNVGQYADRLPEGAKALMRKYPDTFRVDVYPTHRTGIAPQWVYDDTAKNAVKATLVDSSAGPMPAGAFGGTPFPIPKTGLEVMWNHLLRWRGSSWYWEFTARQLTQDGQWLLLQDNTGDYQMPYYVRDLQDKFSGDYWMVRLLTRGPAIRAGEAITGRFNLDETKSQSWVYLTGQRRVRKLPNTCCDTPAPYSAGVTTFDEVDVQNGRLDRFDWKLIGKKDMLIPYNSNRTLQARKDTDLLGARHMNPDFVRWELHRVWVVESALKPGQRHTSPRSVYYLDEDTWSAVWADRYDANGVLSRVLFGLPAVLTDAPGTVVMTQGVYDLSTGTAYVGGISNERRPQYRFVAPYKDALFTPDAMSGEGVR